MAEVRIEMQRDEASGLYAAVAPERNFCTGLGQTPEEARARLELALSLWFDAEGNPLCGPECGGVGSVD